jgi:UTP--glucose-1-phosphate uridylyltransferase
LRVSKSVITAAAPDQRALPRQTVINSEGERNTVLGVLVEEAVRAGVEQVCVVVHPGDESVCAEAAGPHAEHVCVIPQVNPRGYGHALYCAREFVGADPFLHMVGDHLYVSSGNNCAQQLIRAAEQHSCSVSGVQPTRENLLPYFGTVGGHRVQGTRDLFLVERVSEKPTPTEAEQSLTIPGLRAGHYLCFFGMHVLTPTVMELLHQRVAEPGSGNIHLSPVLSQLAARERYLALEMQGRRFPIDVRYGLLMAQLALALEGKDRDEVLTGICELLAQHKLGAASAGKSDQ